MLRITADGNTLYVESQYEEIGYKDEFDTSRISGCFNIPNAEFVSDMILGEMFDTSKLFCSDAIRIIKYMKKPNIKKMHIYLYPKTMVFRYEFDQLRLFAMGTTRKVDISEYGYTIANILYNFDKYVMHWFNRTIQNVLNVIDRDKIKVIYHFNPLDDKYIYRTNSHRVHTTEDEVIVMIVHQHSVYCGNGDQYEIV